MNYKDYDYQDEEYLRRRKAIREKRREKRRRIRRIKRAIAILSMALLLLLLVFLINAIRKGISRQDAASKKDSEISQLVDDTAEASLSITDGESPEEEPSPTPESESEQSEPSPEETSSTSETTYGKTDPIFFSGYSIPTEGASWIGDDVVSTNGILINLDTGKVVAQKDAKTRINPASMTKILTILVAAEHIASLDDTVPITIEVTDYAYSNDCSAVGFSQDEVVTVKDLMYGTILPSGGDAAAALAIYVAGSLEAFSDMMNEKLAELGLSSTTHFTNCVGLYDKDHYSTVYDMAMILKAAEENVLCREILDAHTYTTSSTPEHPEGITISNWFLRRIEDKDTHGRVAGAKTGFVNQSGSCAASYSISNDGTHYICVTAGSTSSWRCIYDHVAIYQRFLK